MEQIECRLRDENKPRDIHVLIGERREIPRRMQKCMINFDETKRVLDKEGS
jgi:hypothetical protein